jgi:hypothetical protein
VVGIIDLLHHATLLWWLLAGSSISGLFIIFATDSKILCIRGDLPLVSRFPVRDAGALYRRRLIPQVFSE